MKTLISKGNYYIEYVINDMNCEFDVFAILQKEGELIDDADFVYYNSNNRSESFDSSIFQSKRNWRQTTYPVSLDRSVFLDVDSLCPEEEDITEEYEIISEMCHVNLSKTNPIYDRITVGLALNNYLFKENTIITVYLKSEDNNEVCVKHYMHIMNTNHSAIEGLVFTRKDEDSWEIELSTRTFSDGLQGIIDNLINE